MWFWVNDATTGVTNASRRILVANEDEVANQYCIGKLNFYNFTKSNLCLSFPFFKD